MLIYVHWEFAKILCKRIQMSMFIAWLEALKHFTWFAWKGTYNVWKFTFSSMSKNSLFKLNSLEYYARLIKIFFNWYVCRVKLLKLFSLFVCLLFVWWCNRNSARQVWLYLTTIKNIKKICLCFDCVVLLRNLLGIACYFRLIGTLDSWKYFVSQCRSACLCDNCQIIPPLDFLFISLYLLKKYFFALYLLNCINRFKKKIENFAY